MRHTCSNKYSKYSTKTFLLKQDEEREKRRELLPVLGLEEKDIDRFEIMSKKSTQYRYAEYNQFRSIDGLTLVHYIEKQGEVIKDDAVSKLRGVVIWNKQTIVRKQIEHSPVALADKLEPTKTGHINLTGHFVGSVSLRDVSYRIYNDGTIIDIMKINGYVHYITSKNLLPRGVKDTNPKPGTSGWIHSPARWASHDVPFMTSFDKIAREVDPNLLDEDTLFPKDCLFSNRIYRFLLSTPDRFRADLTLCGNDGFLTYLGCFEQWDNEGPNAPFKSENDPNDKRKFMGVPHTEDKIYVPKNYLPNLPKLNKETKDTIKPFIVWHKHGYDLETANKILSGEFYFESLMMEKNPSKEQIIARGEKHTGGGSLLVTGTDRNGNIRSFQVSSKAYEYREWLFGNNEDHYKQLLTRFDEALYDFSDETNVELFMQECSLVKLPKDTNAYMNKIENFEESNLAFHNKDVLGKITKNDLRKMIWFNYVSCCNMMQRKMIYLMYDRYVYDIKFLKNWLSSNLDKNVINKIDNEKARHILNQILGQIKMKKKTGSNEINDISVKLDNMQHKLLLKLIKISRDITNTLFESILISNPTAKKYPTFEESDTPKKEIVNVYTVRNARHNREKTSNYIKFT